MWAPVPPEMAYTATRRRLAPPAGALVRANVAATSTSSSSPSTLVMPYWRKRSLVTRSEPVRCPVWERAIDRPSSVRPTFTQTMGTPALAA